MLLIPKLKIHIPVCTISLPRILIFRGESFDAFSGMADGPIRLFPDHMVNTVAVHNCVCGNCIDAHE